MNLQVTGAILFHIVHKCMLYVKCVINNAKHKKF